MLWCGANFAFDASPITYSLQQDLYLVPSLGTEWSNIEWKTNSIFKCRLKSGNRRSVEWYHKKDVSQKNKQHLVPGHGISLAEFLDALLMRVKEKITLAYCA